MPIIRRTEEQLNEDIATQTKLCRVCTERKPFSEFYNFKGNKSDGKSYRCKSCDDLARLNYRINNPVSSARGARSRQLKFKYGISIDEYESLLKKQNYKCAICESEKTRGYRDNQHSFSVDHCHSTGLVRGLLCNNCNRGLGMLGDSVEGLERALKYLKE